MALTPSDVHNVAFSRARIGARDYSEQEVDLFIDLVEQELTRHIELDAELRNQNAELRNRDGGLQKREAQLAEREATLRQYESQARQREAKLRQQEAKLAKLEAELREREAQLPQREARLRKIDAQLRQQGSPLAQQQTSLRRREAQLDQRENELRRLEAELHELEAELAEHEGELVAHEAEARQREDQREAVASCVGAETKIHPASRSNTPATRVEGSPSQTGVVNGTPRVEGMRTVASVHGRHDMERMAIRAVTDVLGNTITETVHERTRRSRIDRSAAVSSEAAMPVEQAAELLKQENAELSRSNELLKAAAALLAAALDRP